MEYLIEQIKTAFNEVPMPNDQDLLMSLNSGEELWIESFLGHEYSTWKDLPDDSIELENGALSGLTPEAFQAYAPAYMIWTLKNHELSNSTTVDNTIYALDLTGTAKGELRNMKLKCYKAFTQEQSNATLEFLRYMATAEYADNTASQNAINAYWIKFD